MAVGRDALVRSDVEQTTARIIGRRGKRVTVREEANRIHIRFVSGERLLCVLGAKIPEFGRRIAGARDERLTVGRQRQRHHVAGVASVAGDQLPGFQVPQSTSRITATGQNTLVV